MTASNEKIPVDLSIEIVRNWNQTYKWIPIAGYFLAFAATFFTGANSLPIPFSTPVASGALTVLQATLVACIINVPGAAFARNNSTVDNLFANFLEENQPSEGFLMWSLVVVLMTAIIWLALATFLELPVSSQQSMQSALLGTVLVTKGVHFQPARNKDKVERLPILWTILKWMVAPPIAGVAAFCFFGFFKIFMLRPENAEKRILIFLPIYYGISAGLISFFIMYQVIPNIVTIERWESILAVALATLIAALLSLVVVVLLARKRSGNAAKASINNQNDQSGKSQTLNPTYNTTDNEEVAVEDALKEYMEMRVLDTVYEEDEKSCPSPPTMPEPDQAPTVPTSSTGLSQSTDSLKQLLELTPNRLIQARGSLDITGTTTSRENFFTLVTEYDRRTLIRHALAEKFDEKIEDLLGFPQLLAACIFSLIQSANDIALVVSPYQAILDIYRERDKYSGNVEDLVPAHAAWWFRAVGGFVASMGFFLCGWRLTQCLGGKLTYVSNSRGLSSQLCSVATIVALARTKFPVSSTHSFIGSLIGVGIADDPRNVNWKLLLKFICGWIGTILFCSGVACAIFSFTIYSPAYVVP